MHGTGYKELGKGSQWFRPREQARHLQQMGTIKLHPLVCLPSCLTSVHHPWTLALPRQICRQAQAKVSNLHSCAAVHGCCACWLAKALRSGIKEGLRLMGAPFSSSLLLCHLPVSTAWAAAD